MHWRKHGLDRFQAERRVEVLLIMCITVANTGSGTPHNTMPPFGLVTYYVKL
jgi:hypothetical protein